MAQPQAWTSDIPVNSDAGRQWQPAVATNRFGESLVVWSSDTGVKAQLLDAAGALIGGAFEMPLDLALTLRDPAAPSVAAMANGSFAVHYGVNYNGSGAPPYGTWSGEYFRVVDRNGSVTEVGSDQTRFFTSRIVDTSVAVGADGTIALAALYNETRPGRPSDGPIDAIIETETRSADGVSSIAENRFVISSDIHNYGLGGVNLAPGADGGFALTYNTLTASVSSPDFNAGKLFGLATVRTNGGSNYFGPNGNFGFVSAGAIAQTGDGNYVQIAFADALSPSAINAQVLDSTGANANIVVQLNQTVLGAAQADVEIVALPQTDTGYVGVWQARGASYDIVARQWLPPELSNEFVVNEATAGDQYQPDVARMPDGRLMFVWTSGGPAYTGASDNIVARIWDGRDQTIAGPDGGAVLYGRPTGMTHANDIISAGNGFDTVFGLSGDDFIAGNDGNDTLVGGDGADTLIGGKGADRLDGRSDSVADISRGDVLLGGEGNDFYIVDSGLDLVDEGFYFPSAGFGGVDRVASFADFWWDVTSVVEILSVATFPEDAGGDGVTLVGGIFNNTITGHGGTDVLFGRGGADTYMAGDGVDYISLSTLGVTDENAYAGVNGANTVIVQRRATGPVSYDIVFEFESGKDRIDVSDYASVNGFTTGAQVLARVVNDGAGSSYIPLGDGLDYVYMVGLEKADLRAGDFIVT